VKARTVQLTVEPSVAVRLKVTLTSESDTTVRATPSALPTAPAGDHLPHQPGRREDHQEARDDRDVPAVRLVGAVRRRRYRPG
jgi:hypothetical protein